MPAALSAGPSLLSVRFHTAAGVRYHPGRNYHHRHAFTEPRARYFTRGAAETRSFCNTSYGVPPRAPKIPNSNPKAVAAAVSVTTDTFALVATRWSRHTYLKPIAPPRAPYHWLLPQFLAQWYTLARVHLLFRSATASDGGYRVERERERNRERERERAGREEQERESR